MSGAQQNANIQVIENVMYLPDAGAIVCAWQIAKRATQVAAQSRGPASSEGPLLKSPIRLFHSHIAAEIRCIRPKCPPEADQRCRLSWHVIPRAHRREELHHLTLLIGDAIGSRSHDKDARTSRDEHQLRMIRNQSFDMQLYLKTGISHRSTPVPG